MPMAKRRARRLDMSVPRLADHISIAGLAIDQQQLQLFVIAFGKENVTAGREIVPDILMLKSQRRQLLVSLLTRPRWPYRYPFQPPIAGSYGRANPSADGATDIKDPAIAPTPVPTAPRIAPLAAPLSRAALSSPEPPASRAASEGGNGATRLPSSFRAKI